MPIVVLIPGGTVAAVAPTYTAQGVNFATTTQMHATAALTGVTDSKTGMISFWFRGAAGSDGASFRVFVSTGPVTDAIIITRQAGNAFLLQASNASFSVIMQTATTGTFASAGGWKHLIASWNLATATIQMYVEDASDNNIATNTNDTIAYGATGSTDWWVNLDSSQFDIADLWFDPDQTPLDLSVTANRRKFISAGLAPVNLGSDGSTPTGTKPAVFFSGAAASWNTNKGSGGGFTVSSGSITDATSNPP